MASFMCWLSQSGALKTIRSCGSSDGEEVEGDEVDLAPFSAQVKLASRAMAKTRSERLEVWALGVGVGSLA